MLIRDVRGGGWRLRGRAADVIDFVLVRHHFTMGEKVFMLSLKSALGALVAWLVGLPLVYFALLGLTVLDMVSAIAAHTINGTLSLHRCGIGATQKGFGLLLVAAAAAAALLLKSGSGGSVNFPAGEGLAALYCGREILSILRNARDARVWMPAQLRDTAAQLERAFGDEDAKEGG